MPPKNGNGAKPKPAPQKQQQNQQRRARPRRQQARRENGLQFAPVAQSRIMHPGNPTYSAFSASDGSIIVRHREFFGDVLGSTGAFQLGIGDVGEQTLIPVQPANPVMFPYLSGLSKLFESYDFERLQIDYVPRCSTATAGFIAMAVDYDAKDAAPSSKTSLMSYHGAVASSPWQSCSLICDRRDLHKMGRQLYTRLSSTTANTDTKTYDVGNLWLAVGGQGSAAQVGEVYVTYTVRLSTPQLNQAAIAKSNSKIITPSAGVSKTAPLGTARTIAGGLPIRESTLSPTTKLWVQEAGQYMINALATGTGLSAGAFTMTGDSDITVNTPTDIPNAAGTLEAVTFLANAQAAGLITLAAAGATTLSGLVLRISKYAPSSTQSPGTAVNEAEVAGED